MGCPMVPVYACACNVSAAMGNRKFVLGLTMDAADEKCLSPSVSRRETREQTLSWNLLVCCQHAVFDGSVFGRCFIFLAFSQQPTSTWSERSDDPNLWEEIVVYFLFVWFCTCCFSDDLRRNFVRRTKLSLCIGSRLRSNLPCEVCWMTWHWSHPWRQAPKQIHFGQKICTELINFFYIRHTRSQQKAFESHIFAGFKNLLSATCPIESTFQTKQCTLVPIFRTRI